MQQMIIANRLIDGRVVFLTPDDRWDHAITGGKVVETDEDAQRLMAVAKQAEASSLIIDPQLIEVTMEQGAPRPTAIREAIRAFGPTAASVDYR